MNNMEEISHLERLDKLCRLCGNKIIIGTGYSGQFTINFKENILAKYGVNVETDLPNVHPTKICNKCYMKLYHWQQPTGDGLAVQFSSVYEFMPHSSSCPVCIVSKRGRPSSIESSVTITSPLNSIKNIAVKYGFYYFGQLSTAFLNIFGSISERNGSLVNTLTVGVHGDGSWYLKVFSKDLPVKCIIASNLPNQMNANTADLIFSTLTKAKICEGNCDFIDLIRYKINLSQPEHFQSSSADDVGLIQTFNFDTWDNLSVIRHHNCSWLVKDGDCCHACKSYRKTLFAIRSRISEEKQESINVNDRYKSKEELVQKVKKLEKDNKKNVGRIIRLQASIKKVVKKDGVVVDSESNDVVQEIIQTQECPFDIESPQYLLWEQQKLQSGLKDSRTMKWHPLILRWCLSIYIKSPTAYKHIRSSSFLHLPCKNTLLKYINFTDPGCGFNLDILNRLVKIVENYNELEKNVCVVFDEMKIKSGLVFCKTTGRLVGFTDMGDINDELEKFGRMCEDDSVKKESMINEELGKEKPLAKYVIVFMVRGIVSNLQYAFGHFASEGFDCDQILPCAHEAIRNLEAIGLKVRAVTADGASPNRKYFRMHKLNTGENVSHGVVYWCWNSWSPDRRLYFICDVPHLIKTTRNNLENSHGNRNTRNLKVNIS